MRFLCIAALLTASLGLSAPGQNAPVKAEGIPPRATPADYQSQAQAGTLTIAAESTGHSVATPEGSPLTTDDFLVIETALFGPPGARAKLSIEDFSVRINGKKTPLPSQPYGLVLKSLKDPELEPLASAKSKTGISTGGGQADASPPSKPKIPIEVRRGWEQRVQKAALPEGDRALPQAGLIFFQYRGKTEKIESLELIYESPAGKATLTLQP
jgi:hypothetical protein